MAPKAPSDGDLLALLDDALAADFLKKDFPIEKVDEELRARGGDPEAIGQRGAQLADELVKEWNRTQWRKDAQKKRQRFLEESARHQEDAVAGMSRSELLAALQAARENPSLGSSVQAAFRKRRPDQSSDDDLRSLLHEVLILQRLAETANSSDGEEE